MDGWVLKGNAIYEENSSKLVKRALVTVSCPHCAAYRPGIEPRPWRAKPRALAT